MRFPFRRRPDDAGTGAALPEAMPEAAIPVIWLLGKSGAGKSSLVRVLTGLDAAEVGNGFRPCTKSAAMFDFPPDDPLLRFLDTRGLGEAGYDPAEDLAASEGRAHVVLAMARLDDPVQGEVAEALAKATRSSPRMPAILVLTGADQIEDEGTRRRAAAAITAQFERAMGRAPTTVEVALPQTGTPDIEALREALAEALPQAALLLFRRSARGDEARRFETVRKRVLFYAGLAAASDLAPLVGVVSVPAAQAAMLAELGRGYGIIWTRATAASFLATLGAGIAARYAVIFGLRQVGKLIPVIGQTAVSAASGTISFATTYALGRAAAFFLHHRARHEPLGRAELRKVYAEALKEAGRGAVR